MNSKYNKIKFLSPNQLFTEKRRTKCFGWEMWNKMWDNVYNPLDVCIWNNLIRPIDDTLLKIIRNDEQKEFYSNESKI